MDEHKYWKSLEHKELAPEQKSELLREFKELLPASESAFDMTRSTFLKLMGLTFVATAAGCSTMPVKKAIPFVNKPEAVTPGVNLFFASTCKGCNASCGILVKQRDGRPIKIEGNPLHPLSLGGVCAVGQASVLSLYDADRAQFASVAGQKASWAALDPQLVAALKATSLQNTQIRLLSSSIVSPFTQHAIDQFLSKYKNAKQVIYDRNPLQALVKAHDKQFGKAVLPSFDFLQADTIVSFDADFLGTWIAPVAFTKAYSAKRKVNEQNPSMSQHFQFEARMSLTGANADERVVADVTMQKLSLLWLAQTLSQQISGPSDVQAKLRGVSVPADIKPALERVAASLLKNRGKSLVICGINDVDLQSVVVYINVLLGNYGHAINIEPASYVFSQSASTWGDLLSEMEAGKVGALIVYGVNPAYDSADKDRFEKALAKVATTISLNERVDETGGLCKFVAPDHHFLEAWGDARPQSGVYSLRQPLISPVFDTRQAEESLLTWAETPLTAYDALKGFWLAVLYPKSGLGQSFKQFWNKVVQDGVWSAPVSAAVPQMGTSAVTTAAIDQLSKTQASTTGGLTLVLYDKIAQRDGSHANNPWLHEVPDPVSKATWDNYACISSVTAKALGLTQSQVVELEAEGHKLKLPVYVQPGQHDAVIAVAMGYGHTAIGKIGNKIGQNAAIFLRSENGTPRWEETAVRLTKTSETHKLACTQEHFFMEGRPIIQEQSLKDYQANPNGDREKKEAVESMWPKHRYESYRWGMAIDLNSCTGCSACIVACQSENNIPVVGKQEVMNNREMHWLRIDSYYSKDEKAPTVAQQPMLCQQCENAPCETVCPVLATTHSTEGLNQQIYNRCVGTRYCMNNCPYKVRRFNWFNYAYDDKYAYLALNPDVTVRTRGVMEKCTFCVQRIQHTKIIAKNQNRKLVDGEIQTACQQGCPANAIVFGDINDADSAVSKLMRSGRAYHVLEDLNTLPSVSYLTKVRNKETV